MGNRHAKMQGLTEAPNTIDESVTGIMSQVSIYLIHDRSLGSLLSRLIMQPRVILGNPYLFLDPRLLGRFITI
jgi:hypothetical protein